MPWHLTVVWWKFQKIPNTVSLFIKTRTEWNCICWQLFVLIIDCHSIYRHRLQTTTEQHLRRTAPIQSLFLCHCVVAQRARGKKTHTKYFVKWGRNVQLVAAHSFTKLPVNLSIGRPPKTTAKRHPISFYLLRSVFDAIFRRSMLRRQHEAYVLARNERKKWERDLYVSRPNHRQINDVSTFHCWCSSFVRSHERITPHNVPVNWHHEHRTHTQHTQQATAIVPSIYEK